MMSRGRERKDDNRFNEDYDNVYVLVIELSKVNCGRRDGCESNTRNLFKKQIVIVFNKLDNKLICSKHAVILFLFLLIQKLLQ